MHHNRSSSLWRIALAVLAFLALAPAGRAGEPLLEREVLSDEKTLSRWVHASSRAPLRKAPDMAARTVGKLRLYTEDGHPELYLALERHWVEGRQWVRLRIPGRPNGRKRWVLRSELGDFNRVHGHLRINRRALRATLYGKGLKKLWSAPIGIGKPSTHTPAGRFYIRQRIPNLGGSPIYGPLAFGTSAYSKLSEWPGGGVIGIHGTNQPSLLPGRVSNGCIRLRNRDVLRLGKRLKLGTPVRVL